MVLKRNKIAALACATASVALVASACSSSSKPAATGSSASGNTTLNVWIMVDAQTGWPTAVTNATKSFEAQHPGDKVNVTYQTWGTYLDKFATAQKAGAVPDVMEVGNTQAGTPA